MKARFLIAFSIAVLASQAIRPAKNISRTPLFTGKNDITVLFPASAEVRQTLATSCYDCHSDQTRYPWYAEIEPVGWWLAKHVNDGRRELNFSAFGTYPAKRQRRRLEALCDEVQDRRMPLKSYLLIHRGARLTDTRVAALCQWAESAEDRLVDP